MKVSPTQMVRILDHNNQPQEILLITLMQWVATIGLEDKGLKCSGGSVTARARRFLSTPPRYPRKELLQHLKLSLKDCKEQLKHLEQSNG
jgi:hypothetical protein